MKTPDIADRSITSDKISNGAVGNANIADNSITSDKILDGRSHLKIWLEVLSLPTKVKDKPPRSF